MSAEPLPITPLFFPNRRTRLWIKENRQCHWCHQPTTLTTDIVPWQATIDHVVPRGMDGADTEDNCVSACAACNRRRNIESTKHLIEGHLLTKMPVMPDGHRSWVEGTVGVKGTLSTKAYKPLTPYPLRANDPQVLKEARDTALTQLVAVRKNEASLIAELAEAQAALAATTVRSLVVKAIRGRIERVLARLEGKA